MAEINILKNIPENRDMINKHKDKFEIVKLDDDEIWVKTKRIKKNPPFTFIFNSYFKERAEIWSKQQNISLAEYINRAVNNYNMMFLNEQVSEEMKDNNINLELEKITTFDNKGKVIKEETIQ